MATDDDLRTNDDLVARSKDALAEEPEEPPVVARMVIEIRSDGLRTVARGAVEDVASGEKVALEAKGSTPLALAGELAKSLFTIPQLARSRARGAARNAVKALLSRRSESRDDEGRR